MPIDPVPEIKPTLQTAVAVRVQALAVADGIVAQTVRGGVVDYPATERAIAVVEAQDPNLGGQVRALVEDQLTPIQRAEFGQFAEAQASGGRGGDEALAGQSLGEPRGQAAGAQQAAAPRGAGQAGMDQSRSMQHGGTPPGTPVVAGLAGTGTTGALSQGLSQGALPQGRPGTAALQTGQTRDTFVPQMGDVARINDVIRQMPRAAATLPVNDVQRTALDQRNMASSTAAPTLANAPGRTPDVAQPILGDIARWIGVMNPQLGLRMQAYFIDRGWLAAQSDPRRMIDPVDRRLNDRRKGEPCRTACPSWQEYETGHWRCLECGASTD
jgi:hypothetical protein